MPKRWKAVLIKSSDRQWRYSRYPEIPLFGRAARENQREILSRQRDELSELYATQAFDVQKIQRAHHAFSQFVGQHISKWHLMPIPKKIFAN